MKTSELERFFRQIILLLASRKAPGLSKQESELMMKINRGISPELQVNYNKLIAKRRSETLTAEEYDELLGLTAQIEKLDAERLEYLNKLACIRQMPLIELMKNSKFFSNRISDIYRFK